MSRARHHMKKAKGGAVYYEGGGSEVAKEAAEKKHGGRVKHPGKAHGAKSHHRLDKKARGGHVMFGHEMKREHESKKERKAESEGMKERKHGGRVNSTSSPMAPASTKHPFSSAATAK